MTYYNSSENAKKIKRRDTFIAISLALYIFSSYVINIPNMVVLGSVVLYIFLGLSFFKIITIQTPLKITSYTIWYLSFGILGLLSYYYALNDDYVVKDLYVLLVSLILTFSYIQYVQNYSYIVRIFSFYAYSPIFLVVYLFISGEINTQRERLGTSLFGNANILASSMMISLLCILWFVVYSKKKYLLINITLAIFFLYIIALTGGRKFLLIPFIFLLLLLILKNWRENMPDLVLYIFLFVIIIFFSTWTVINVPVLYNSIGVRFEGLLSFINGNSYRSDSSTIYRFIMIREGWKYFLDKPILGYGLNNFQGKFSEIFPESSYAHNNYIELMVSLGTIGILLYYSFYAYIVSKLIRIRDDGNGIRNFFLAFMLVLLIFEIGAVTYKLYMVQIFIGLASAYVWLHDKKMNGIMK